MNATRIVHTYFVSLALGLLLVHGANAQTLYSDSFGGPGTALDGTLVQSGTLQTGAVAWSANTPFLNDGNIDETAQGSAILPFSPMINSTYTLTMDVLNNSATWIALGFKDSPLANPGTSQLNDRFSNGGGLAWMLYRNNVGNANSIQLFAGPSAANPIIDIDNQGAINFANPSALKIVLDTTGDGSSYTADFQINGASVSSGAQLINQPISNIQSVGLSFETGAATPVSFDNFLLTQAITGAIPNEWTVNGGGTFATPGNWTMGTPTAGSTVRFANAVTAPNSPAVITLAAPATLGEIQFSNSVATYNIAGPSTLALTGAGRVSTVVGNHEISAVITGSVGLTKAGAGQLLLSANNTYTGTTNVQAGSLRVLNTGAVDGAVNVSTGASVFFEGNGLGTGFSGTFTPDISGAGEVGLSPQLTTETVTFNSAKSYTGITTVNGGTLAVSGAGTLGTSDGTAASRTQVGGNQTTGKLALNGVSVSNELLVLGARELAAINATHVTSAGSNTWSGPIKGELGGSQYNIESASGTLNLAGTLSAPDTGVRTYVFSGAGNTNITGKIVDVATDANGAIPVAPVNALNNVGVIKRGAGKLTIGTATGAANDYWRSSTTVEAGTLEVLSDGANNGELRSSTIAVRSGAVLDIDSFSNYSVQSAQDLSGGGTIQSNTVSVFGDSLVAPGDNGVGSGIGTMTFVGANADLYVGTDFFAAPGARGGLAFDLSGATTVGSGVNDLITGVRNLTLDVTQYDDTFTPLNTDSPVEVLVTPVQNQLAGGAAGTYRLVNYSGTLTNTANVGVTFAPQLQGVGAIRQTLAVSTATGNQVNLVVSGAIANLTWNGSVGNNTWNIDTSTNWTGADNKYKDLDNVTFGAAGIKDVELQTNVAPGVVNFSGGVGSTYTVTGVGGIRGGATVNVNSGTVRLQNRANAFTGPTTIASGARLELGTSSTGGMTVNGTLAVPSNISTTLIDDFSDGNLSEYTFAKVLDQAGAPDTNISFSASGGTLASSYAGAPAAEQVLLFRNDGVNLDVNEELRIDGPITGTGNDLGLAIGEAQVPLAPGAAGDTRTSADHLFISFRNPTQLNSRGFNNAVDVGQVQNFGVTANSLFIARTGTNTVELGWYQGTTRNISRTITVVDANMFNNVGFYTDLRVAGAGFAGLDNLQIVSGTAFNAVAVNGNLNLTATGTLDLDVSAFDFTSLDVTGSATLAGTLSVNLLNGFTPAEGASYNFLSAVGGIVDAGLTFDLPTLTGNLEWDTSDFFTTGTLSVIADAGLAGDFDMDGDVDGRDFLLWQRNPGVGNLSDWQTNYGMTGPLTASSTAVPEPSSLCLVFGLLTVLGGMRSRK